MPATDVTPMQIRALTAVFVTVLAASTAVEGSVRVSSVHRTAPSDSPTSSQVESRLLVLEEALPSITAQVDADGVAVPTGCLADGLVCGALVCEEGCFYVACDPALADAAGVVYDVAASSDDSSVLVQFDAIAAQGETEPTISMEQMLVPAESVLNPDFDYALWGVREAEPAPEPTGWLLVGGLVLLLGFTAWMHDRAKQEPVLAGCQGDASHGLARLLLKHAKKFLGPEEAVSAAMKVGMPAEQARQLVEAQRQRP